MQRFCLAYRGRLAFHNPYGAPRGEQNLLKNPGFEEMAKAWTPPPNWITTTDSLGKAKVTDGEAHGGRHAIAIPANAAVEQTIGPVLPGAYLARCWVKSESEQPVTFLLQNPDRPWAAYTCAEIKVPRGKWVQIEAFCPVDRSGPLTLTVGGMSREFRFYHGVAGEMAAPIIADDFELIRYQPNPSGWAGAACGMGCEKGAGHDVRLVGQEPVALG